MKAAMVLMISVQDIIMRRCGVIEVNNVDQVIYLNIGMRMRNRLKLQEIYIQEIRRRFAFLLNQIEKLKFFSTFNLEHRSSCSTKVHISNVLFYRYVAANYLAVSKTMEQESSHQARGWVYCDQGCPEFVSLKWRRIFTCRKHYLKVNIFCLKQHFNNNFRNFRECAALGGLFQQVVNDMKVSFSDINFSFC